VNTIKVIRADDHGQDSDPTMTVATWMKMRTETITTMRIENDYDDENRELLRRREMRMTTTTRNENDRDDAKRE